MKIAVLGAGALGSVMGGLLHKAGQEVELWDVNAAHVEAINQYGLHLVGPWGDEYLDIKACHPEKTEFVPELIILLTKTLHTEAALAGVQAHIQAGAMVLTLQNGLGNVERLQAVMPADQILYGCTMMPARFEGLGHVSSQGNGAAVFKALTSRGQAFAERLAIQADDLQMRCTDDTDCLIWQKAAFNCAMNASAALTGAMVGQLATPNMKQVIYAVALEVVNLAQAKGIAADYGQVQEQINRALELHTEHKPSMLQDMEAGRETEIESLCAEVSRQGPEHAVGVPLNTTLAALIQLKQSLNKTTITE